MAKKKPEGYLSAKESRRISRENRRVTNELEKKRKRKNVPESEYTTQMHDPNNVLEIQNLHSYFFTDVGTVKSVDGIDFEVPIGKTVGVVGESGCGKSVTSLSIMQLLQRPQGQIVEGEIRLNLGDGKAYDIATAGGKGTDLRQSLRRIFRGCIGHGLHGNGRSISDRHLPYLDPATHFTVSFPGSGIARICGISFFSTGLALSSCFIFCSSMILPGCSASTGRSRLMSKIVTKIIKPIRITTKTIVKGCSTLAEIGLRKIISRQASIM